jgi:regulatory protein
VLYRNPKILTFVLFAKAMTEKLTPSEARLKLEYYCSYQERCHQEVVDKLYQLGMKSDEIDAIVVHLLQHNFLNEERFARAFARGRHRIKSWGKIRIVNELKQRHITAPNIKAALTEIPQATYQDTFDQLAEKHWNSLTERKGQKKNKKFCDYLLRRGWESNLVYEKMKELESSTSR